MQAQGLQAARETAVIRECTRQGAAEPPLSGGGRALRGVRRVKDARNGPAFARRGAVDPAAKARGICLICGCLTGASSSRTPRPQGALAMREGVSNREMSLSNVGE